jgi:outer membrane protein OmpU
MSTEAFAADKIKLGLGGFMRHYVGVINDDEASEGATGNNRAMALGQKSNSEVYFTGATTLDNGLTVKAHVQLEADGANGGTSNSDHTDESYLSVSSDAMGEVYIGQTKHAMFKKATYAPHADTYGWYDLDDWGQMADDTGANQAFSFTAYKPLDTLDDSSKIGYMSPSFGGVSIVASYGAAEGSNAYDADSIDRNAAHDGATYAVIYSGDLAGTAVKANLGQHRYNGSYNTIQAGLSVAMAGFTVGGSYVKYQDDTSANNDGNTWDLGVAYETGPYSVSASYMSAKEKGTTAAGDDKDTGWRVSGTYDMGAGVGLTATYFNLKRDVEGSGTAFTTGKSAQVNGVIAGIEVGF